jgi:hypothetical protein
MRKTMLLLALLFVLQPRAGRAQLVASYGIKAGLTSASHNLEYRLTPAPTIRRRVGMTAAGFVEWLNLPSVSLITQIEYTQRGMGQDFLVTGPSGPQAIGTRTLFGRLHYLSIPVLVKAQIIFPGLAPYLLAGPRADFLLSTSSDEGAFDILYSKMKRSTYGASVGLGIQTSAILPVKLLFEARYNFDLQDSYATDLLNVRNNAFDFWLGAAL